MPSDTYAFEAGVLDSRKLSMVSTKKSQGTRGISFSFLFESFSIHLSSCFSATGGLAQEQEFSIFKRFSISWHLHEVPPPPEFVCKDHLQLIVLTGILSPRSKAVILKPQFGLYRLTEVSQATLYDYRRRQPLYSFRASVSALEASYCRSKNSLLSIHTLYIRA